LENTQVQTDNEQAFTDKWTSTYRQMNEYIQTNEQVHTDKWTSIYVQIMNKYKVTNEQVETIKASKDKLANPKTEKGSEDIIWRKGPTPPTTRIPPFSWQKRWLARERDSHEEQTSAWRPRKKFRRTFTTWFGVEKTKLFKLLLSSPSHFFKTCRCLGALYIFS
jgi:hypothetical protein